MAGTSLMTRLTIGDCRVGGGALDCSCAGLRPPHKLDVQFSRIQLSRRRPHLSDDEGEHRGKVAVPALAVRLRIPLPEERVSLHRLNDPLIFHESFQCGRIACPAITRLSSPGGTTRTACRCSDVASPSTTRGVSENRSLPARSNVPVANEGR